MEQDLTRNYQTEGTNYILEHNGRVILADEAGTGKTKTTLNAIVQIGEYPVLILSTKPGLGVWQKEILKWHNEESYIFSGTPQERATALEKFKRNPKFLITNYAFVKTLCSTFGQRYFKFVAADEIHLPGLLNHKTDIYNNFQELTIRTPYLTMPTGTPMKKNPADLYAPLSLLYPKIFRGYWNFVKEWCETIKTEYNYEIEPLPKDIDAFRKMLHENYLIRRLKQDVLKELPPKTRQPIPVYMEPAQEKLYNQLATSMWFEYGATFVAAPNQLAAVTRARQLLVTPQILGIPIIGGALRMLYEIATEEISLSRPIAIFTPFNEAIPFIKEQIKPLFGDNIWELHGGLSAKKIQDIVDAFQECKSKTKAIICTIKSGVSQTITEAKTAIFLGYEWGPYDNSQAEDRLHRRGQLDNVRCLYLLHEDVSTENHMIDILNRKQQASNFVLSPQEYYERMVQGNAV